MTAHQHYQLLVGEVGIPRRQYLYELQWWEIRATLNGYRQRQRPYWEMARWIAWAAAHCMGGKNIPTMQRWAEFPWEREAKEAQMPTPEEQQRLLDALRAGKLDR